MSIKIVPSHKDLHDHILFAQRNYIDAVTFVCIGSIHGNEQAGVKALQNVANAILSKNINLVGNLYALEGNRSAFKKGLRFQDKDLNRMWTNDQIEHIKSLEYFDSLEDKEQFELYSTIKKILTNHKGPFVFVDLHTTSADTVPFITISDSLNNREAASKFNLPIILGIEESLDGPLLTYINEFGHISLGFEAGQHNSKDAVLNCEAFIWLMMAQFGLVEKSQFPFLKYHTQLQVSTSKIGFYDITYRHALRPFHRFKMLEGFVNFDPLIKGQPLAIEANQKINSAFNGFIFMPLYQEQGEDGFFITNKISKFWLGFSTLVRTYNLHKLLPLLPGVRQDKNHDYTLIVNPRVATFLTTKIFHLFGYRKKVLRANKLHFIKRDRKISPFI